MRLTSRLGITFPKRSRILLPAAELLVWLGLGGIALAQLSPPTLTEGFSGASYQANQAIALNSPQGALLTFTISNPNVLPLTGIGFTDPLPAGLAILGNPNLTNSCGGTIGLSTGVPNAITLSGGTLSGLGGCSITLRVTGVAAGLWTNTTSKIGSSIGLGASASATLLVVAPPVVAQFFGPSSIPVNGTSLLEIVVRNPSANVVTLTSTSVTNSLPANMQVANPPSTSLDCSNGTGTVTSGGTAGDTQITVVNMTVGINGQCAFTVNVTATAAGALTNVVSAPTCCFAGVTGVSNPGVLLVGAPTITKFFGVPVIVENGTTTLTFNIGNPNASLTLTSLSFNDVFPVGLGLVPFIASPHFSNGCGGSVGGASGPPAHLQLSGVSLSPGAGCTLTVDVQGINGGVKRNDVAAVAAQGGGNDPGTSTAFLTVLPPVATNDLNNDGFADILWRNSNTGDVSAWLMNGAFKAGSAVVASAVDPSWQVVGVGDFDGGGEADILWQNSSTGGVVLWFMNGTTKTSAAFVATSVTLDWKVVGVGDFNGDGMADILWRNSSTGDVAVWLMNGATKSSSAVVASAVDPSWKIVGISDFNGDGKSDILWQNSTAGNVALWLMNGASTSSSSFVATGVDPAWQIVPFTHQ